MVSEVSPELQSLWGWMVLGVEASPTSITSEGVASDSTLSGSESDWLLPSAESVPPISRNCLLG